MDLFTLKLIGLITMFMDHYHYIIGGPEILTIVGRLSYPIFAFALVEGYKHTRDVSKYLVRIGISAVLLQTPIWLLKYNEVLNIFFTLFLGLTCIYIYDKFNKYLSKILIGLVIFIAIIIKVDYGMYGILLILAFYIGHGNKYTRIIGLLLINIWLYLMPDLFELSKVQIYSIFTIIPIYFYNGKKGKNAKYLFYIFYPLHFLVMEGIKIFVIK